MTGSVNLQGDYSIAAGWNQRARCTIGGKKIDRLGPRPLWLPGL